jgi:signal transduction histidine kinase
MARVPEPGPGGAQSEVEFLRHVCHELRQPLVVAVGYVSMLEEGSFGELPTEAAPIVRTIAERLDAMNAIIDRIAEDARERAGDSEAG